MSESEKEPLETNQVDESIEINAESVKKTAARFLKEYEDALKTYDEKAAFDAAFTAASIDMHHDEMDKLVDGEPIAHGVDLIERSESEEFRNSVLENAREVTSAVPSEDLGKISSQNIEGQSEEKEDDVSVSVSSDEIEQSSLAAASIDGTSEVTEPEYTDVSEVKTGAGLESQVVASSGEIAQEQLTPEQLTDAIDGLERGSENITSDIQVGEMTADPMGEQLRNVNLSEIDDEQFVHADVSPKDELDELDRLLAETRESVNASVESQGADSTSVTAENQEAARSAELEEQEIIAEKAKKKQQEAEQKSSERQEAEYDSAAFAHDNNQEQAVDNEQVISRQHDSVQQSGDFDFSEDDKLVLVKNEQMEGEGFAVNKSVSDIADFENSIKNDGTLVRTDPQNPENKIEIKFTQDNGFEIDVSNFDSSNLEDGQYNTSIATESGRVEFTIKDGEVIINDIQGEMEGQLTIKNGEQELTLGKDGKMDEVSKVAEHFSSQQQQKHESANMDSEASVSGVAAAAVASATSAVNSDSSDDKAYAEGQAATVKNAAEEDNTKAFAKSEKAVSTMKKIIDAPGAIVDGVVNTPSVVVDSVKTAASSVVTTALAATDSVTEKGLNAMAKIPDAMAGINNKIADLLSEVSGGLKEGNEKIELEGSTALEKSWFSKAVDKIADTIDAAAENRSQAAESHDSTADELRSQAAESAEQVQAMRDSRDKMQEQSAMERSILAAQLTGRAETAEQRKEELAEITKVEPALEPTESQKVVSNNISDKIKEEGELDKEDIAKIRAEHKELNRKVLEQDDGGHALKEANDSRLEEARKISTAFEDQHGSVTIELLESASQDFNSRMEAKLAADITELDAAREIFQDVLEIKGNQTDLATAEQGYIDDLVYVAAIALEAAEISSDEKFKAQQASFDKEEVERVNVNLLEKLQEYENLPVHEAATKTYEDLKEIKDEVENNPNSTEEERVNANNDWFAASELLDKVEEQQGISEDYSTMKEFAMSKGGQVAALALLASGSLMTGAGVEAVINGDPLLMNSGVAGTSDDISTSSTPVADMVTEGWENITENVSSAVADFIDSAPEIVESIADKSTTTIVDDITTTVAGKSDAGTELISDAVSNNIPSASDLPDTGLGDKISNAVDALDDYSEAYAKNGIDGMVELAEDRTHADYEAQREEYDKTIGDRESGNKADSANLPLAEGDITQESSSVPTNARVEPTGEMGDKDTPLDLDSAMVSDRIPVKEGGVEEVVTSSPSAETLEPRADIALEDRGNELMIEMNEAIASGELTQAQVDEIITDSMGENGIDFDKIESHLESALGDKYDALIEDIRDADNINEAQAAIDAADLTAQEERTIESQMRDADNNYAPERIISTIENAQGNANTIEEIREMAEEAGLTEAQEEKLVASAIDPNNNYDMDRAESRLEQMERDGEIKEAEAPVAPDDKGADDKGTPLDLDSTTVSEDTSARSGDAEGEAVETEGENIEGNSFLSELSNIPDNLANTADGVIGSLSAVIDVVDGVSAEVTDAAVEDIPENTSPDSSSIDDTREEIQQVVSGEQVELSDRAIATIASNPEIAEEVYNDNVVKIETAKNHNVAVEVEVAENANEATMDMDLYDIAANLDGVEGGHDVDAHNVDTSKITMSEDKAASTGRDRV